MVAAPERSGDVRLKRLHLIYVLTALAAMAIAAAQFALLRSAARR